MSNYTDKHSKFRVNSENRNTNKDKYLNYLEEQLDKVNLSLNSFLRCPKLIFKLKNKKIELRLWKPYS